MQTAARQLIISWNTEAGVSRITRCDFHRPISHTDTHTHTSRKMSGGVGLCLLRSEWVTSLRTLRHGNTARALTASKILTLHLVWSAPLQESTTEERERDDRWDICSTPGHSKLTPLSLFFFFFYFVFEVISAPHGHAHTASDDASNHTANLSLQCMLVGQRQREKGLEIRSYKTQDGFINCSVSS